MPSGTRDHATWYVVLEQYFARMQRKLGRMITVQIIKIAVMRLGDGAPIHCEALSIALLTGAIIPAAFANAPKTTTIINAV